MPVPILKQGQILIATVRSALSDSDTELFRERPMERVTQSRAQGIIVDLTAIDVLDSSQISKERSRTATRPAADSGWRLRARVA